MPDSGPRRVVILTAIPVEYQAVRAYFINLHEETHPLGTVYERGTFSYQGRSWDVGIVEVGAGITDAALAADRAINHFNPILVLFVGVAGGLKDVIIGDVVAATKVYGYASGKAKATFETRPDVSVSTFRMEQRARAEARKKDWLQRIIGPIPDPEPRVYVAPIASGDQVVASTDSALYHFLRTSYSDALAVEMEGYGFLRAVHAHPHIDALIIRGISDLIEGKSGADAQKFQEVAARHASAFAFEILVKLDAEMFPLPIQGPTISTSLQERHESEPKEQKTILREKIETPSPEATTSDLLQEFRAALPSYCEEIRMAFIPFYSGQDIYQDHCDSVIEALDSIYEHMQKVSKDATTFDLVVECDLDNIQADVSKLKVHLLKFRSICPPKRIPTERREYNIDHNRICTERNRLFESLDQLKNRLNKGTALE